MTLIDRFRAWCWHPTIEAMQAQMLRGIARKHAERAEDRKRMLRLLNTPIFTFPKFGDVIEAANGLICFGACRHIEPHLYSAEDSRLYVLTDHHIQPATLDITGSHGS